jgi:hypothetical protein
MSYKIITDDENEWGCVDCSFHGSDNCEELINQNNLPNCIKRHCHFELDDIPGLDTDEMGNCFSDADPGL